VGLGSGLDMTVDMPFMVKVGVEYNNIHKKTIYSQELY
jgi:hypothetical protein